MTDFGVFMFTTDRSMQPAAFAAAAEARDFESVFVPEHTHATVKRDPPGIGAALPDMYWRLHDPFIALTAAAAATERIKLGTAISLITEHDPITLAKQIASLDQLSNGRLILGIGAGWNAPELEDHGVPHRRRWSALREWVLAMREIWTSDEAEFHGTYVDFDPVQAWPRPIQPGGPPILLGANANSVHDRVVDYGDGWLPLGGEHPMAGRLSLTEGVERLKATADRAGRSWDTVNLTVLFQGEDEAQLRKIVEAGFHRVIFWMDDPSDEEAVVQMDRFAELARRLS